MSAAVNKAILIGYLGRDPEIRNTQDGRKIANLSVATSDSWVDKRSGERVEKTEWHRVVVFNEALAEIAGKYGRKGGLVYIEGQIQTRKYVDKEGIERYSTEIVLGPYKSALNFLSRDDDREPDRRESGPGQAASGNGSTSRGGPGGGGGNRSWDSDDFDDSEIPF